MRHPRYIHSYNPLLTLAPRPDHGVTLVELLVGTVIASIVLGIAFGLANFNRRLYIEDQARNSVNQNLRTGMELIGLDLRQAGENVNRRDPLIPAIQLQQSGGNSILTVRREISSEPLPLCAQINNGVSISSLTVTGTQTSNNCASSASVLTQWRDYVNSNGGQAVAYLSNGDNGQLLTITSIDVAAGTINVSPSTAAAAYGVTGQPSDPDDPSQLAAQVGVRLLEERRYSLNTASNTLEMVFNRSVTNSLVNGIQSFQVEVLNPNVRSEFCNFAEPSLCAQTVAPFIRDAWNAVQGVQVTLISQDTGSQVFSNLIKVKADANSRTMTEVFFPRNALNF